MKKILIILLFTTFGANAQTEKDPEKKPLTDTELQLAIKKYVEMSKSETYILFNKSMSLINEKLNGINLTHEQIKAFMDNEDAIKSWLSENIKKTKFTSSEEGVELFSENFRLLKKKMTDNAELYVLISRANKEQLHKILEPERSRLYQTVNDKKIY